MIIKRSAPRAECRLPLVSVPNLVLPYVVLCWTYRFQQSMHGSSYVDEVLAVAAMPFMLTDAQHREGLKLVQDIGTELRRVRSLSESFREEDVVIDFSKPDSLDQAPDPLEATAPDETAVVALVRYCDRVLRTENN